MDCIIPGRTMWNKAMYRLAISPMGVISVLYSSASRHFSNLIHSTTTDPDDETEKNDIPLKEPPSLDAKLEGALLEIERKDKEIQRLKDLEAKRQEELDAKTRELESVTSQLEDRVRDIEAKSRECLSITKELQTQNRAFEKRLQDQIEMTRAAEAQLKKAQTLVEDRSRIIDALQKRLNTTVSSLETRTAELQQIRSVLGEPDSISNVDAVKLVSALNAEIFQTAALLAESFGSIASRAVEGLDNRTASGRVRQMFGPRLVELLKSIPHDENQVLLRVAFQACMVVFSDWISAAWHFQTDPAPQFFGEVYRNVWISEDQAVSGRWRSLTRRHIQQLLNEQVDNIKSRFAVHISNSLADVLLCAGLHNKHTQVGETVMALAGEKILTVVEIALRLNRVLGEDITAADIETTWVHSQESFDPMWMEDDYGDWRGAGTGPVRVLCTTDLGLRRLVKAANENGWEDTVLLKPKVALEELLDSLELEK